MSTFKILLLILPWVICLVLISYLFLSHPVEPQHQEETTHSVMLREIEALGKVELVKYHFQEITESKELSRKYFFDIVQWGPDMEIVLISTGSAVGCIDLASIEEEDIVFQADTVIVTLPPPELCTYHLDMENTRIYSITTNEYMDQEQFIQKTYQLAEQKIREAALSSGILEQTEVNARLMLQPILSKISGKTVIFTSRTQMDEQNPNLLR